MKHLILLFLFSSFLNAKVDWSDPNNCKLPDNSEFINLLVSQMTLEQKVGQIIMPEINSVTPDDAKKYHFGTILNNFDHLERFCAIFGPMFSSTSLSCLSSLL